MLFKFIELTTLGSKKRSQASHYCIYINLLLEQVIHTDFYRGVILKSLPLSASVITQSDPSGACLISRMRWC